MIDALVRFAQRYIPFFRKCAERKEATALMGKLQETVEKTGAQTADKLTPRKHKVKE